MTTRKCGTEHTVNTTKTGDQVHRSVAALDNGGYVIMWEDDGPATHAVRGQRYDAGGRAVGGEFTVPTAASAEAPSVTSFAGGFIAGYDQVFSAADSDPIFQRYDAAGNPA